MAYATAYEQKKNHHGQRGGKQSYKLRISQFIVLPVCQRLGIGSTLLEHMYLFYLKDKRCTEITVEDPSDDFQQMKDALDIKLIWNAGFLKSLRHLILTKQGKIRKGPFINKENFDSITLDQDEILDIQDALKLKKQNILRCFELIILTLLDQSDPVVH